MCACVWVPVCLRVCVRVCVCVLVCVCVCVCVTVSVPVNKTLPYNDDLASPTSVISHGSRTPAPVDAVSAMWHVVKSHQIFFILSHIVEVLKTCQNLKLFGL